MSNATPAPAAPARVFGRCLTPKCRTRVVTDDETFAAHGKGPVTDAWGVMVLRTGEKLAVCLEHKAVISFSPVKGKVSADPCGPRCWAATTATCKCSCGGAEHGSTA